MIAKKKIIILFFVFWGLLPSFNDSIKTSPKLTKKANSAIVTGHPEATRIGAEILKKGGNAIDASLATQLALAV